MPSSAWGTGDAMAAPGRAQAQPGPGARPYWLGRPARAPQHRAQPPPRSSCGRRLLARCQAPGGEPGPGHDEAAQLLSALQQQQRIGSEYGEGFMQVRLTGEAVHLDVDTLNERLQLRGAQRMRTAMRPDEAFGMIFSWDGVVADMRQVQRAAWLRVAEQEGLPFPEIERQVFNMRPERAITDVLQWTRDWPTAQRLAWALAQAAAEEFASVSEPLPGVRDWLLALRSANVPCALVTCLNRTALRGALQRMRLAPLFRECVTAEDGTDTAAQAFLSAAVKLGRPPRDCVVFDSSPTGVAAAHNCSCKAVAIQGTHKAYHLKQADLTCASMAELSVINIRRLFANRGLDFMDRRKAFVPHSARRGGGRSRRVSSGTLDPP